MYKYYKMKNTSTMQALCVVDESGKIIEKAAIIGTERELLDCDVILPRYRHFTDSDVNDDNYLVVFPEGKVVSCGSLDEAKQYLDNEFGITQRR